MSPKLLCATLLIILVAAAQLADGEPIQFDASQLSNCTYEHACIYSWSSSNIWIGGKVPSPTDDVDIKIGNNIVKITCDNNCVAKKVQTSGKQLTFKLPSTTSAAFDQVNALSGIINFDGGSLTVRDFVKPKGIVIIAQFGNMQLAVDNMQLTAAAFMTSTVQIGTMTVESFQLIDSHMTAQYQANLFDILSMESSTLTFQGGCNVPDQTPTRVLNSTIFSTPACPLMLNSLTTFQNSLWTIEAPQIMTLTILSPFNLLNSTIKLTRVNLSVKAQISMRQNSVIEAEAPVEISYGGIIGGQGSVVGDLTVKNFGRIESGYGFDESGLTHQQLTILGTLSLDRSSTVHLQRAESIQANSILLSNPSLEISFGLYSWNWTQDALNYTLISTRQGEISGSFDFINVTMALGYYQLLHTKSDLTFAWHLYQPSPPQSVNAPVTVQVPVAPPIVISVPSTEVLPPISEPNSSQDGTDFKVVVIVIESIMICLALILGGALVYRRFKKRRDYNEVPSFDQL